MSEDWDPTMYFPTHVTSFCKLDLGQVHDWIQLRFRALETAVRSRLNT